MSANPDKRTTAYENIFGRPTAKPKGPQAQPNPPLAAGGPYSHIPPPAANNPQYWSAQQAANAGYYPNQAARWASNPSSANGTHYPYSQARAPSFGSQGSVPPIPFYQAGGTMQAGGAGYPQDPIDRRASVTPSLSSQDPRNSPYYPNGHQSPPPTNSTDAFYGAVATAGGAAVPTSGGAPPTAASVYAASYYGGAAASNKPLVDGSNVIGAAGYANPNTPPPFSTGPYPSAQLSHPSHPPPGAQSVSSFIESNDPSAPKSPPRLPSIDIHAGGGSQENWFAGGGGNSTNGSSNGQHGTPSSRRFSNNHEGSHSNGTSTPTSPVIKVNNFEGGKENEGYSQSLDYQDWQRQSGGRSAASSMYGGAGPGRRGSFESDRESITNSIYTLGGGPAGPSSRSFYPNGPSSSGYFAPAGPSLTPYGAPSSVRQPRMRTASNATQQGAYAQGYGDSNTDWRQSMESTRLPPGVAGRFESRSMSTASQAPPVGALTPASPHGSIQSALPPSNPHRRGPLVYPALLSRVAEAFKSRVAVSERTKDGLSYTDAFDGREAVDRIAYIIKTTDRNLALLLGRALDAQKFFHDVTYDHRLRDSPNELYQFRVRLTSPFGSEDQGEVFEDANDHFASGPNVRGGRPMASSRASTMSFDPSSNSASISEIDSTPHSVGAPSQSGTTTPATSVIGQHAGNSNQAEDENALPTGVFTLLTDCYSPTCTRDRLCYSIACPRRLEQQARLNLKPQPGLKRSISKESLGDTKEAGLLWAETVDKAVFDSLDDTERKRQEAINEVMYTERDFVRDLEYLRDVWIKPLRSKDIIPEAKRDDFVTQVFWNVLEIHAVSAKLAELLNRRQKQSDIVDRIGDILLEMVPLFQPFVKYGAHQLYGKYEFEKEKSSNPAFAKFVDENERLPESRKLELNGYLTKPTTRLARYPLLLQQVLKFTPEDHVDQQTLPKVIKIVKEFLSKVNIETGKSENRFNLAQLDQQLVFKQGEAVDLRLRDEQRELVFKGPLKRRGGTQSESAELQVFLFDHALLMVKAKTVHKNDLYKVYRKPIPLELLIVTVYDEVPTGKGNSTRPKSVTSRTSTGNRLSGGAVSAAPKQDAKTGYALTFTYLGRKGYPITLWASTFVSRKKWFEHIEARQEILRQRSNIFDTITLSENFFVGPTKVNCSVPFDFGRRIIYGTDDGVYLSDLREKARPPIKVLPLPDVTQVDVLEEYQILIVLAERSVHTFTLDALDPSDPMASLKRGRRISSHTSFFKAGICLGRTLVCVVKSSSLSSTIKTLEPIEQNVRGKKQPTFRKLLQGGQETLRVFKEFYIPTESSSIHFLKTKLCVGCTKGFEIVDLETLDTQGLLDPADSNLDFVHRKETVKPIAIYRIDGEFLLCYDEFAFYVNKNGWRSKGSWIIHWEGNPTSFALHYPYVLAFEPSFIEVRHVKTGALHQVITGFNLRCLFADVPAPASAPSSSSSNSSSLSVNSRVSSPSPYGGPPPPPPGQFGGYPGLQRQQSFGNMLVGPNPAPGYPPRPPAPVAYGPQGQVLYPTQGVPYAFTQAQAPRPPQPQRNPVWESVAASRNQIVFIGDTTVFCVRLADGAAAASQAPTSSNGRY